MLAGFWSTGLAPSSTSSVFTFLSLPAEDGHPVTTPSVGAVRLLHNVLFGEQPVRVEWSHFSRLHEDHQVHAVLRSPWGQELRFIFASSTLLWHLD